MNNDYERYDFWFRETVTVKNETKEELIESEYDQNDSKSKTEYILNITQNFI
jgi:hypothetical protein